MDINLTGPIAANLVANLAQPWYNSLLTLLSGAFSAAIGALAVYYTSKRAQKQEEFRILEEERQEKHNRWRESYSRLKGQKILVGALYKSYGHAFFESQRANEVSQKNWGRIIDSIAREGVFVANAEEILLRSQAYLQYEKAYQKSRELYTDLARSERDLWEIIGSIEILFPETDSLVSQIDLALKKYKIREWAEKPNQKDLLNDFLLKDFAPAVKNLLIHLKSEIDKDTKTLGRRDEHINARCYRICKFFCNP